MSRFAILRLKSVLAQYGFTLVLVFALLGTLLLGAAGWVYANPTTTEVTDQTNKQTIRSDLHTSATTTANTSLYKPGTELEDQPVYLVDVAPSVTLTQRTSVPDDQAVHIEQDITLRYRVARDGSVFWRESHLLTGDETTTSTGELVTETSLDVRELRARLAEIQSEVGQAGTVRAQIIVTVSYETDRYTGELSETVPVQLTDNWYAIDGSPQERTHSTPETRTVSVPVQNSLKYLVPGAIGSVLLATAGAIAISCRRGFDRRRIEQCLRELRYTEWISTGSVSGSLTETAISIDSLEGLVDIAIDTDNRVIHDERDHVFVVIDGPVVYYYSPD